MPAKLDPFVDVLLREQGDQLYLLPDEPVTLVKDGKPRKVSKQPLTDQHIYALLVEVAPSESADHIDGGTETEFEYLADRGMVRVRIVPEMGRLTAVVSPALKPARAEPVAATPPPAAAAATPPTPAPTPSQSKARSSAGAAAPRVETPSPAPAPAPRPPPPAGPPLGLAGPESPGAGRTPRDLPAGLVPGECSALPPPRG